MIVYRDRTFCCAPCSNKACDRHMVHTLHAKIDVCQADLSGDCGEWMPTCVRCDAKPTFEAETQYGRRYFCDEHKPMHAVQIDDRTTGNNG